MIPRNGANFDSDPSTDSNSAVSNSAMYFLEKIQAIRGLTVVPKYSHNFFML